MKRFSNILLAVDECKENTAALKRAVTLARNNQAHLTICTVVDAIPADMRVAITAITPAELNAIAASEKQVWLDALIESVPTEGVPVDRKLLVGKPFIEIIRQVLKEGHDLVIKCAETNAGLTGLLFGSTDMHLLRKCPCPVWITGPEEQDRYRRILAAVDRGHGDPVADALNRQILEMSSSLALTESSELHVVHAWRFAAEELLRSRRTILSDNEIDAMVEEEVHARRRWLEDCVRTYGTNAEENAIDPQLHLIKGTAEDVVPTVARDFDVDLIVMGTVARTGIPGFFMGNTAESILNRIECSVLTVKPPGFESPVRPKRKRGSLHASNIRTRR